MFVHLSWHGSSGIVAKAARLAVFQCIFSALNTSHLDSPCLTEIEGFHVFWLEIWL